MDGYSTHSQKSPSPNINRTPEAFDSNSGCDNEPVPAQASSNYVAELYKELDHRSHQVKVLNEENIHLKAENKALKEKNDRLARENHQQQESNKRFNLIQEQLTFLMTKQDRQQIEFNSLHTNNHNLNSQVGKLTELYENQQQELSKKNDHGTVVAEMNAASEVQKIENEKLGLKVERLPLDNEQFSSTINKFQEEMKKRRQSYEQEIEILKNKVKASETQIVSYEPIVKQLQDEIKKQGSFFEKELEITRKELRDSKNNRTQIVSGQGNDKLANDLVKGNTNNNKKKNITLKRSASAFEEESKTKESQPAKESNPAKRPAIASGDENNKKLSKSKQKKENSKVHSINNFKSIELQRSINIHDNLINFVLTFTSKNEKMIASASNDNSIKITRLRDYKTIKTIQAHTDWVIALAMTNINGSDVIASASDDKTIKLFSIDNDSYTEIGRIQCDTDVRSLVTYEHKGKKMLACGLYNGAIELWNLEPIKRVNTLKKHKKDVQALCVFKHLNMLYMLSGDSKNKLNVWNLDKKKHISNLSKDGGIGAFCTFEFDGGIMIAALYHSEIVLWKMTISWVSESEEVFDEYHVIDFEEGPLYGVQPFVSNNGKTYIATVSPGGWFRCIDVQKKKVVHEFKHKTRSFYCLNLFENEDGDSIFVAGGESPKTKKGKMTFFKAT